jgi:signal transduction histidine kinase
VKILALFALLATMPAVSLTDQRSVLVLYSTRRDAQIVIVGERELPAALEAGYGQNLNYYSEYIDLARFPDPEYQSALREFLMRKYRGQHIDVIIAMQDIALQFLGANRNDLLPDTPVVFFSASLNPVRIANSTGVASGLRLDKTVTLASTLQPDLKTIFVVTGAGSDDRMYESAARSQFASFEPQLAVTYLTGLVTRDLEAKLAMLPPHSMVYYLVVDQDGAGHFFHPLEYLDRVVAASNAPVYSWVDSAMDHGIVGGSLKDQAAQMKALANLTVRILRGESADAIPLMTPDLNVPQVSARELARWRIVESRVPPGTRVKFRDPTIWDRYSEYILIAIAILFAQAALIAALLVQRARRRGAEDDVRRKQAELLTSYGRIRDLGGRLLDAQETERALIARELHDDIGQQIALLAIDLELLEKGRHERLTSEALSRAQDVARSVHDLSHRLHPAKLRLIGLVPALTGLQHDPSHGGIPTTFTHENVPPKLPADVTLCLFRIVQEALQNAMKYSAARFVTVNLNGTSGAIVLTIADDGVGFDVDAAWGKGLGLISMTERVEAIGGTMSLESRPGTGTRLAVRVPLPAAEAAPAQAV